MHHQAVRAPKHEIKANQAQRRWESGLLITPGWYLLTIAAVAIFLSFL